MADSGLPGTPLLLFFSTSLPLLCRLDSRKRRELPLLPCYRMTLDADFSLALYLSYIALVLFMDGWTEQRTNMRRLFFLRLRENLRTSGREQCNVTQSTIYANNPGRFRPFTRSRKSSSSRDFSFTD